jgi:hypothetical protein
MEVIKLTLVNLSGPFQGGDQCFNCFYHTRGVVDPNKSCQSSEQSNQKICYEILKSSNKNYDLHDTRLFFKKINLLNFIKLWK